MSWVRRHVLTSMGGMIFLFLTSIAFVYQHDAKQLEDFYRRRDSDEMKLRSMRVCLDMQLHPENWRNKLLRPPCEFDVDALRYWIPEYENAVAGADQVIRERKGMIEDRRHGTFGFIQRWVD
jgi:hypothetical protein